MGWGTEAAYRKRTIVLKRNWGRLYKHTDEVLKDQKNPNFSSFTSAMKVAEGRCESIREHHESADPSF